MDHNHYPYGVSRLSAGNIKLRTDNWTVTVSGEVIKLTYLEFRLLQELIRARGTVLAREDLLQIIWGHENIRFLETRTVDVHMARLRKKLGAAGRHLITVRKVGYRMDIAAEWIHHGTPSIRP